MHKSILNIFITQVINQKRLINIPSKSAITLILIFLFIIMSSCQSSDSNLALVKVGDDVIYQDEFIERYEDYILQTGIKDNIISRKEVLNSMISEYTLLKYDDNSEIEKNNDYQIELGWLKKQAIIAYLKDREVYANIKYTDKDLREAFLRSNQKLAARHLFAATEEEVNNISELLKIGVDFETLAKQCFTDSLLKSNGGYLGYFSWGDMEPEFEDKAFSMKIGEISNPIKTNYGYSIIKLEDRVTHPLLTEDEFLKKKSKFEQILRIRDKKPSEKRYINEVVKFDEIKFRDDQVNIIWENIKLKLLSSNEVQNNNSESSTVVSYDGKDYSANEIIAKLNQIPEYHSKKITSSDKLKTVIKGLILQEKLLEIANEKNYDENENVISKISKMKTNLFMKFKISEIIEKFAIEDTVIYNFYNSHPDFFSTHNQVNVQEILVKDLGLAKSLIEQLNKNEDFGQLAKNYSIRKTTAENNGIIGLTDISKFGRLSELFQKSKLNKVLGPIEIENIYGIFKVIERKQSERVPFEDAEEVATMAVKFKLKNEILQNYVEDLKTKIGIEIDLKNLGSTKIFQYN